MASATHTTPNPRYVTMQERFGLTVHEQLTCGFHVHTFIESPEEGVAVMDRIRDKLAVLIALSANSPFWNGAETGFESYRTQAWNRWPGSGPSQIFGTPARVPARGDPAGGKRRAAGRGDDLLRRAAVPATTPPWRSGSPTSACGPRTRR